MRRSIAAATVAASIAIGGLGGAVLGAPGLAGAAESATGAASWVQDALSGLVDDGTITQAQADAVGTALEEARPERRFGHGGFRMHLGSEVLTDALGVTEDELRTALQEGKTIAEVAEAEGVALDAVIDALVAEHETHLDERVAAGDLTQAQADERLEGARERITAMVNGERPERPAFGGHRGFGRRGGMGPMGTTAA